MSDSTTNTLNTWVEVSKNSDFTIYNLPFGVFKNKRLSPRTGIAIGDKIVDLSVLDQEGFFSDMFLPEGIFLNESLNKLISLGKVQTKKIRERVQNLLLADNEKLRDHSARGKVMVNRKEAEMLLPVEIGDYTDFYSSMEHATNVGKIFRDPENALLPNWKHMPVGYHGRSSSIIPSGTPIYRPKGQFKTPEMDLPGFGPSKKLDFELEVAFITGKSTKQGDSVSTADAEDYIFGFVLFNDWSARDIQAWEYVPLGPFLGKNFASSISPWVVTLEALEHFKVGGPVQEPEVLPYLRCEESHSFDINLEVYIQPDGKKASKVSSSNYKNMYWNVAQQLAHQTINGCNINVGDMMSSGTISGEESGSYGSMLELSWNGKEKIKLEEGEERAFIEDGDTVIMKGFAEKDGVRIGFGEVKTKVLPAK
ncbi:fumarylacetoacetase [Algoriphagus halophytocola]|uniref:fumarylacetoacetase n=1 Tax=Algoriphagus halophytocola TaxID=2991499 RepID=A0ABY6MGK6_9BACT|nr:MULTISPECIES: fumarylacetoacetase [unclassified Algoriphagus]UZD22773.1 fumarylacetoacetase [Algoriphagus sp. TR-M5]WBL44039.1 fumarylacetoacetase [Algoriphagus sp. TR-M9]